MSCFCVFVFLFIYLMLLHFDVIFCSRFLEIIIDYYKLDVSKFNIPIHFLASEQWFVCTAFRNFHVNEKIDPKLVDSVGR